jgi:hypothetical protein
MHDIRYNDKRDEILVTNPFAQAILIFKADADTHSAPVRIIQGPRTDLGNEDSLEVDSLNDEILIPASDGILVFPAGADGDVAPIRRLRRPAANREWSIGRGIAVDNVRDLIVTDGTVTGRLAEDYPTVNPYNYVSNRNTLLIFDRKGNGEVNPIRIIRGAKTGIFGIRQIQVYPKGGWIMVAQISDGNIAIPEKTFLGVWSVYDSGDVAPRWKIDGKAENVMLKPRGVAYSSEHKEVYVSDMRLNAVLTFSFPELFDQVAQNTR